MRRKLHLSTLQINVSIDRYLQPVYSVRYIETFDGRYRTELQGIKDSFIFVLMGVVHWRDKTMRVSV